MDIVCILKKLSPNQVIIFGFGLIIFLGTILLTLPVSSSNKESIGFIDALFTATSAVCVTGLIVLEPGSDFSLVGQLIILVLIQVGGLGFMTYGIFIAILLGKKLKLKKHTLRQLSKKAVSSQDFSRLIRSIFFITLLLETVSTIILTIRWHQEMGFLMSLYYSIFHSISAFNNAGFVLWSDSLNAYVSDPVVNIVITSLFITTGLGFTVLLDLYNKRKWNTLTLHSKIVLSMSIMLTIIGFFFILLFEWFNLQTLGALTWNERLFASYFQSVTTRTAGFNTITIGNMLVVTQLFIIFLMFIGASSGGTGGGIKTSTFLVLVANMWRKILGKKEIMIFKRTIASQIIQKAILVTISSLAIIMLASLFLMFTESHTNPTYIEILFEVTSAFSTVGLSLGLTPKLTPIGKIVIICTMFIGRLGPLTFAYFLTEKKVFTHKSSSDDKDILIG